MTGVSLCKKEEGGKKFDFRGRLTIKFQSVADRATMPNIIGMTGMRMKSGGEICSVQRGG